MAGCGSRMVTAVSNGRCVIAVVAMVLLRRIVMDNDNTDDRPILKAGQVYNMLSPEGWVDVRELTVGIKRSNDGVTVEIWPIEVTEGNHRPIATAFAPFEKPTRFKRLYVKNKRW